MSPNTLTTFLAALASSALLLANPTAANGCYTGGELYSQVGTASQVNDAITTACDTLATEYLAGASLTTCIDFADTGNRIDFAVSNKLDVSQTLANDDCVAAMTIEVKACSHGSVQVHGDFTFTDDPNAGPCLVGS